MDTRLHPACLCVQTLSNASVWGAFVQANSVSSPQVNAEGLTVIYGGYLESEGGRGTLGYRERERERVMERERDVLWELIPARGCSRDCWSAAIRPPPTPPSLSLLALWLSARFWMSVIRRLCCNWMAVFLSRSFKKKREAENVLEIDSTLLLIIWISTLENGFNTN